MKTYIINLEYSARRRSNILREAERHGLDHEIVTAVDGRKFSSEDLELLPLADSLRNNDYYSPTIIAAALSHAKVYERMLESDVDVALVLEDDAVPGEDFGGILAGIRSTINQGEIVVCHYMCFGPLRLSRLGSRRVAPGYDLYYPVNLSDVTSGAAYVITRAAAASLLATVFPIRAEADAWELFQKEGGFETIRFVYPMPVTVRGDKSTIAAESQTGLRKWLTSAVDAYRVPPFYQMLRIARLKSISLRSRVELVADNPIGFAGNRTYEEREYQEDRETGGAEARNLSADAIRE
ncbi:MAG TPA: glycosyltransferase family 25 protein [Pyrinomonadaceae bacterium]|nr:glycosyltransferase family 25 protein [Pyrinomonadaceae bacterium]